MRWLRRRDYVSGRLRPLSAARTRSLGFGVLYLVALAWLAAVLGTWQDDEYTLATTAHGAVYAWHRAIGFEAQAPLYFVLEALWRELAPGVWFARLSSVLCAVGIYAAALRIGRRIAPGRDPLPFAIAVALNPFIVFVAMEIRLYSFGVLLSALLWLAFDAGFATGVSRRERVAFAVYAIAAIYTQYFLGFLVVGAFVALVAGRRRAALLPFVVTCEAIAIAIVPAAAIARSQVGVSGVVDGPSSYILAKTLLHPLTDFVLPLAHRFMAYVPIRRVHIVCFAALAAAAVACRPRVTGALAAALGFIAAIEALYVFVAVALRLELFMRHYFAMFVPALVAAYAVLDAVGRRGACRTFAALAVAYAAFDAVSLVADFGSLAKVDDTRGVDRYLAAATTARDIVAIFPPDALPAYARSYRGPARLVPFPHAVSSAVYDAGEFTIHSAAETRNALDGLDARRVFFVAGGGCAEPAPSASCLRIERAIATDARFRLTAEHEFYEATVFELDRRSATSGSANTRSSA